MAIGLLQEGGRTWFAAEGGEPFVSLGVNHLQPDCFLAPYNIDHIKQRYGEDLSLDGRRFHEGGRALDRLVQTQLDRMVDLGFNTLGLHSEGIPPHLFDARMHHILVIESFPLGSRFRFEEQTFPDIFSPAFEAELERHARKKIEAFGNRDLLLGYAFSDIPRWYFYESQELDAKPVHPWVDDLWQMGPGTPGGDTIRRVLGSNAIPKSREQSDAVMEVVVRRWYEMHGSVLTRIDPDRLIFGDKLHSPHRLPAYFAQILKEHVDVMLIQWYTPFETQDTVLRDLHARTGKPVINGDSSFSCRNPERHRKVKGWPVESMEAVGQAYHDYLKGLMGLPFSLGWHHCGWVEQWDGDKQREWEIGETGFYDPHENPHQEVVSWVRRANASARNWHQRA